MKKSKRTEQFIHFVFPILSSRSGISTESCIRFVPFRKKSPVPVPSCSRRESVRPTVHIRAKVEASEIETTKSEDEPGLMKKQ